MIIKCPCKINLFLYITGKREDGYHELCSLMCCMGLYDIIDLRFGGGGIRVKCAHPSVPDDETNLVHRAAGLFFQRLGRKGAVEIELTKNIPVAAGLGGGSSDAAGVLMGLNDRFDNAFSQDELMEMGSTLGADIPFFIFKKPAIATGIGEILQHYEGLSHYHVVLANPGYGISTGEVYKKFNFALTNVKKKHNSYPFNAKRFNPKQHVWNDLETVTAEMCREVEEAKEAFRECGAQAALMSGSGPTVFGLFTGYREAISACRRLADDTEWSLFHGELLI